MERPTCGGLGFVEEELYIVVIGPKAWPWPFRLSTYTTAFCCLTGRMRDSFCCLAGRMRDWFKGDCEETVNILLWIVIILILVLIGQGSKAPRTNLEAFTIHDLLATRDNTSYHASGNFTVLFRARNPSWVVGFRHRYLSTLVTVFYNDTQLGQSEVPRFSQAYDSSRTVSTGVVFRDQRLNESVGLSLMNEMQQTQAGVGLRVSVDAFVMVRWTFGWIDPSWFNLTCSVEATQTGALLSKACS